MAKREYQIVTDPHVKGDYSVYDEENPYRRQIRCKTLDEAQEFCQSLENHKEQPDEIRWKIGSAVTRGET